MKISTYFDEMKTKIDLVVSKVQTEIGIFVCISLQFD